MVTDSCRDGWNVQNCSASQVQNFGDCWSVQNWWWMKCTKLAYLLRILNMNTPKFALSQLWEHKLCASSEIHVDVYWNPRCFGSLGCACMFCCLICMKVRMLSFIKLGCIRRRCGMKENILNFTFLRCALHSWNFLYHQL